MPKPILRKSHFEMHTEAGQIELRRFKNEENEKIEDFVRQYEHYGYDMLVQERAKHHDVNMAIQRMNVKIAQNEEKMNKLIGKFNKKSRVEFPKDFDAQAIEGAIRKSLIFSRRALERIALQILFHKNECRVEDENKKLLIILKPECTALDILINAKKAAEEYHQNPQNLIEALEELNKQVDTRIMTSSQMQGVRKRFEVLLSALQSYHGNEMLQFSINRMIEKNNGDISMLNYFGDNPMKLAVKEEWAAMLNHAKNRVEDQLATAPISVDSIDENALPNVSEPLPASSKPVLSAFKAAFDFHQKAIKDHQESVNRSFARSALKIIR